MRPGSAASATGGIRAPRLNACASASSLRPSSAARVARHRAALTLERALSCGEEAWPPRLHALEGLIGPTRPSSATRLVHKGPSKLAASVSIAVPVHHSAPMWHSPTSALLVGSTPKVCKENHSGARAMFAICASEEEFSVPRHHPRASTCAVTVPAGVQEEGEFLATAEAVVAGIEALRNLQQAFNGSAAGDSQALGGSLKKGRRQDDDHEDEAQRRRERFALYKMVRKIESEEIPPLDRSCMKISSVPPAEQSKVLYNASSDALLRCHPDIKRNRLRNNSASWVQRSQQVNNRRSHKLEESQRLWSSALAQKTAQGQLARARRFAAHAPAVRGCVELGELQTWSVLACLAGFLTSARASLKACEVDAPAEVVQVQELMAPAFEVAFSVDASASAANICWLPKPEGNMTALFSSRAFCVSGTDDTNQDECEDSVGDRAPAGWERGRPCEEESQPISLDVLDVDEEEMRAWGLAAESFPGLEPHVAGLASEILT